MQANGIAFTILEQRNIAVFAYARLLGMITLTAHIQGACQRLRQISHRRRGKRWCL